MSDSRYRRSILSRLSFPLMAVLLAVSMLGPCIATDLTNAVSDPPLTTTFTVPTTVVSEPPATTAVAAPTTAVADPIPTATTATAAPLQLASTATKPQEFKFWSGFGSGLLTIWAMEIGDKTFFIAAVMSMKHGRLVVFAGAFGALAIMTVLSVVVGLVMTKFIPPAVTHYIGAALFVVFGLLMLWEAWKMSHKGPSSELADLENELMNNNNDTPPTDLEDGMAETKATPPSKGVLRVLSQTFLMTFLAEWGDRSQIATVTLSATKNVYGVTIGAVLGHFMCTGMAVVGGKFLATRISERTVAIIGGILFLLFAAHSFITGP